MVKRIQAAVVVVGFSVGLTMGLLSGQVCRWSPVTDPRHRKAGANRTDSAETDGRQALRPNLGLLGTHGSAVTLSRAGTRQGEKRLAERSHEQQIAQEDRVPCPLDGVVSHSETRAPLSDTQFGASVSKR